MSAKIIYKCCFIVSWAVTRRNANVMSMQTCVEDMPIYSPDADIVHNGDRLTFHPVCGSHVTVTQSGRTALRPRYSNIFE